MASPRPDTATGDREAETRTEPPVVAVDDNEPPVHRPAPVTVLAMIRLVTGIGYAALALSVANDRVRTLAFITASSRFGEGPIAELSTPLIVATFAFLAAVSLAACVLLLRVRQLGWTLAMLLSGLTLAVFLWVWWTEGSTSSLVLFVEVVSVFYLNQRGVKETFGIVRRKALAPGETVVAG
jgi:hypothetical protein